MLDYDMLDVGMLDITASPSLSLPFSSSFSLSLPPSFCLSLSPSLFLYLSASLSLSLTSLRERELHAQASRKCGRALSIPHSVSQTVSMCDYYIKNKFKHWVGSGLTHLYLTC
jgi:hypothetical protein